MPRESGLRDLLSVVSRTIRILDNWGYLEKGFLKNRTDHEIIEYYFCFLLHSLTLLLLITIVGLIHRWTNPGHKSLSNLDLKQLGIALAINLSIIAIVWTAKRLLRKTI